MTPTQVQIIITLGGMEASHILAETIKVQMLYCNQINPVEAVVYSISQLDQAQYIWYSEKNTSNGNDVHRYINRYQQIYGKQSLNLDVLSSAVTIDFLDPILWYSLWSMLSNTTFAPPMIGSENFKFLPAARLIMAPYGLEREGILHAQIFGVHITAKGRIGETTLAADKIQYAAIKYVGNKPGHEENLPDLIDRLLTKKTVTTYGFSIESPNIYSDDGITIGFTAALWYQPDIFKGRKNLEKTSVPDPLLAEMKLGGMGIISAQYEINDFLSTNLNVGYKTRGYMQGYGVDEYFHIGAGASLAL